MRITFILAMAAAGALATSPVLAETLTFSDPVGDDNGPGNYLYPTDPVYLPGSFDLTGLTVEYDEKNVEFSVDVNSKLKDPWGMEVGFAVQMAFIHIDTDGVEGSGHTGGMPGTNLKFAEANAWEKVVVLSPQPKSRVASEVRSKAEDWRDDVLIPGRTRGKGKTISGKIKRKEFGDSDPATWSFQVVMQSNEGFPSKTDLLTRKVNEYEGQHRFGGGTDYDCDPHVMDVLAGKGSGADDEVAAQHEMLKFACSEDGEAEALATLTMVKQ